MKKLSVIVLILTVLISLTACSEGEVTQASTPGAVTQTTAPAEVQETVPEDFAVVLTWNCYGVSSYDSRTGKLVKTTDSKTPEDYITQYRLTEEDKAYFYDLIKSMDVGGYPEVYDPQNGLSKPSMTLILTVVMDGTEKTIRAENIGLSFESQDERGQTFLSVCQAISERLTATDAWKALPPYEVLYE